MSEHIRRLIVEAEQWRKDHKSTGRHIEAAAASIRLKALRDCLHIVEGWK